MIPTNSNVPRLARSTSLSLPHDIPPLAARRTASLPPMSPHPDPRPNLTDLDAAHPESSRRLHALAELLATELGYLLDLRVLVSVYLRLLPVLKTRSSLPLPHSSSSNTSIPYLSRPPSFHGHPQPASLRAYSHPHLNGATNSVSLAQSSDSHLSVPALPHSITARAVKATARHLFSASDLDAVTRNAEELLMFHEALVHRLHQVTSPLGVSMTPRDISSASSHAKSPIDVHRAISAVSSVFVNYATSFDQYQSFCSGHSEAFDIVRKVQHRYPAEWEAFELRCAALAAEIQLQDVSEDSITSPGSGEQLWDVSNRRHSLSSLEVLSGENPRVFNFSVSESGHTDRDSSNRKPRLMFMDYMIKPVQRVCRYPLLFDQLQDRTGPHKLNNDLDQFRSSPRNTVKAALRTMRTVASLVDEARRQQELMVKSAQIVSRISQGLLTSAASHNRPAQSTSLTSFLSSLSPCYLSGSLDVIHYRSTNMARLGTVRAKYLGAFLFSGGFLVLVKVTKSKVYEPKHWFNLRLFELVDSNLDDVLLPSWFRLSSKAHMFEFAASCRREKDIWVDAIRRAIAEEPPWTDEPPSSLLADLAAPVLEIMQFETISPLPTIQSIPELDDMEPLVPTSRESPPAALKASYTHFRAENSTKEEVAAPTLVGPSRRSSVVIHSAPVPESNTFHLVRSTAPAREQVDRGLLDVFSEKCLTARFHAHTHEEDLFEAQRVTRSFTRSTSALTMASAMSVAAKNRLTKRESVLVPRKKGFIEGSGSLGNMENWTTLVQPKPARRRHPRKLKIVAKTKATSQGGDETGNEPMIDSPSPMSHCSSVSFAAPPTPLATSAPASSGNADGFRSHSEFLNVRQNNCVPKRSRSMIENVRGFFAPRSASPTTALNQEPSTRSSVSNSSLLRWWSRESLRRRVRSAPDDPRGELPSALTTRSLHVEAGPRPLVVTADGPYSQPDLHYLYSGTSGSSTLEFGVDDPSPQKKGGFSSRDPQRRWTASTLLSDGREEDPISVPTRIRRNFSFLHRFTRTTRDCDDTMPL